MFSHDCSLGVLQTEFSIFKMFVPGDKSAGRRISGAVCVAGGSPYCRFVVIGVFCVETVGITCLFVLLDNRRCFASVHVDCSLRPSQTAERQAMAR